jgi:hypothetical protein
MLGEWLKQCNNRIITNSDLDGVFSAMLLQKYYGVRVVGLTNSSDMIIAETWDDFVKAAYIDMYMADQYIYSVDQHVITYDKDECVALLENKRKLNPNLERCRSFTDGFTRKFPFSTFHYLIAIMARDGIEFKSPSEWFTRLSLRADDVVSVFIRYAENVDDWRWYMNEYFNAPLFIGESIDYVRGLDNPGELKTETERFLKENFDCETKDGGFKAISDNGVMNRNLLKMFHYVAELFNVDVDYLDNIEYRSIKRDTMRARICANINKDDIISYAYINSPKTNKAYNFSCTFKKGRNKSWEGQEVEKSLQAS